MNLHPYALWCALFAVSVTITACGGDTGTSSIVVYKDLEVVQADISVEEARQRRAELGAGLRLDRVELASSLPLAIRLSAGELRRLALAEAEGHASSPGPKLIGVTEPVDRAIDFGSVRLEDLGDAPVPIDVGAIQRTQDGFVWTAVLTSEGAQGVRVHLTGVELAPGAELYVYSAAGEAFGPYTGTGPDGSGDFWSASVSGDEIELQLYGTGAGSRLIIDELGHIDENAMSLGADARYAIGTMCYDASCVENASCQSWSHMQEAANATAHLQFVDGRYIYLCSGGLLADSDPSTAVPYVLTANHCISRQNVASTLEAFFQYGDSCSSTCGDPEATAVKVSGGADLLSHNSTGDYSLLRLGETPPGSSVYLGWSTAQVAYADGDGLHRTSHPSGGPLAYSEHRVDASAPTCGSWPRGSWIYSRDTVGATEGGSSGSPVLNDNAQVVGQLSGGCGTNVNDVCDADNNATVDGAFASYYASVSAWLGGGTACADDDNDTYQDESCGGTDCNDSDASINPGADEVCDDGIDNDCDGNIDEDCGGQCLPRRAWCSTNAECCSNRCRRHRCR